MKKRLMDLLAILFYTTFAMMFMRYVLPLMKATYGGGGEMAAIVLFVIFAFGCGYFGRQPKSK